jgi:nitroreductase
VDEATVKKLLEAAMAALSAACRDPWRCVVIRKRDILTEMAGVLSNGGRLQQAAFCASRCVPG